eukprot:g58883.t1
MSQIVFSLGTRQVTEMSSPTSKPCKEGKYLRLAVSRTLYCQNVPYNLRRKICCVQSPAYVLVRLDIVFTTVI